MHSFRRPHDWAGRSGHMTSRSHLGHVMLPSPLSMPERSSGRQQVRAARGCHQRLCVRAEVSLDPHPGFLGLTMLLLMTAACKVFLLQLRHACPCICLNAAVVWEQDTSYRPLHPIGSANGHQPESPRFLGASPLADGASTLHTITAPRVPSPRSGATGRSRPGADGGSTTAAPTDRRSQYGTAATYWTVPASSLSRGAYTPGASLAGPTTSGRPGNHAPGTHGGGSPTKRAHWSEASTRPARGMYRY